MSSLSFIFLVIWAFSLFYLIKLSKVLLILVFLLNQTIVLLIFSVGFIFHILLISILIFIISFLVFALGLVCFSLISYMEGLVIYLKSFFLLNIGI